MASVDQKVREIKDEVTGACNLKSGGIVQMFAR